MCRQYAHVVDALQGNFPYATDPAETGCRTRNCIRTARSRRGRDNRIAEDAHDVYRDHEYGRLAEKTDRIPEGVIRMHDERTHHYHYDSQTAWCSTRGIQHGEPQVESRYSRMTRWAAGRENGCGGGSVT